MTTPTTLDSILTTISETLTVRNLSEKTTGPYSFVEDGNVAIPIVIQSLENIVGSTVQVVRYFNGFNEVVALVATIYVYGQTFTLHVFFDSKMFFIFNYKFGEK